MDGKVQKVFGDVEAGAQEKENNKYETLLDKHIGLQIRNLMKHESAKKLNEPQKALPDFQYYAQVIKPDL